MKSSRVATAAVVAALLITGPLAPVGVFAQAPPPAPTQPPQPPAPAVMPPITSEVPGEARVPTDPVETLMLPATEPVTAHDPTEGDAVAAGFLNVVYVPGKAIICTAGVITATVVMLATFGSGYRAARGVFMEGCSQPWALTAPYVSGKVPGPGDPGYDPSGRY